MSIHSTDPTTVLPPPVRVQVGIDAVVVANHHVCVREIPGDGQMRLTRFTTPPTLAGLNALSARLSGHPGVVAVAEPTSMTWLALSIAMRQAGGDLSLLGARHAARLRGAIIGKDKSDVIDADVLATAGEVFTLGLTPSGGHRLSGFLGRGDGPVLERYRRDLTEGAVPPAAVVNVLDPGTDRVDRLGPGGEGVAVVELGLQGRPEALDLGVVSAHAGAPD